MITKYPLLFLFLAIACALAGNDIPEQFGSRLEEVNYPFPVKFFRLKSQNEEMEMAYMDIPPEKPNGRSVLLLHGKNFNGYYWESTIRVLAAAGYRVIVPDQIGFGKATKPESYQYTFEQLATNTLGLLDQLGVAKVSVVGHSMGGMLATRFALMVPDRVEMLALIDPIGLEDWKRVVPYRTVDQWYRKRTQADGRSTEALPIGKLLSRGLAAGIRSLGAAGDWLVVQPRLCARRLEFGTHLRHDLYAAGILRIRRPAHARAAGGWLPGPHRARQTMGAGRCPGDVGQLSGTRQKCRLQDPCLPAGDS